MRNRLRNAAVLLPPFAAGCAALWGESGIPAQIDGGNDAATSFTDANASDSGLRATADAGEGGSMCGGIDCTGGECQNGRCPANARGEHLRPHPARRHPLRPVLPRRGGARPRRARRAPSRLDALLGDHPRSRRGHELRVLVRTRGATCGRRQPRGGRDRTPARQQSWVSFPARGGLLAPLLGGFRRLLGSGHHRRHRRREHRRDGPRRRRDDHAGELRGVGARERVSLVEHCPGEVRCLLDPTARRRRARRGARGRDGRRPRRDRVHVLGRRGVRARHGEHGAPRGRSGRLLDGGQSRALERRVGRDDPRGHGHPRARLLATDGDRAYGERRIQPLRRTTQRHARRGVRPAYSARRRERGDPLVGAQLSLHHARGLHERLLDRDLGVAGHASGGVYKLTPR